MKTIQTDVLIAGAGSGGFGAAIRLLREDPSIRVVIVEAMHQFGGTSTIGGVNCWEPGVGGLGVHYELYDRLRQKPNCIGVGKTIRACTSDSPFALSAIDGTDSYESSLRRSALHSSLWRRVHFEPDAMSDVMESMLLEAGNVDILYGTRLIEARVSGRSIQRAIVENLETGERTAYEAACFIDCTGGVKLARLANCGTVYGEDHRASYNEPSAPLQTNTVVNGVTLMYRATRITANAPRLNHEYSAEARQWLSRMQPVASINQYPNGDLNINVLPVMEGHEFLSLDRQQAMDICKDRVIAHWAMLGRLDLFAEYTFGILFPMAGIRESHRLVGRYVLREQDVRSGFLKQELRSRLIAYSDHALDTHGETNVEGANLKELAQPYGVPYECLLPQEIDNLIVATRGASFTHIAAASCRLSRTMMAMGEAAGIAAAIAIQDKCPLPEVPVQSIRERLLIPEFEQKMKKEWELNA